MTCFLLSAYFVIDLAVLASRREYLNLEKWCVAQINLQLFSIRWETTESIFVIG